MNTAARLEHTGKMNRIHVSEATAELLKAAGKEHWLRLREDVVEAKGLGKMRTYWANVSTTGSSRGSESHGSTDMLYSHINGSKDNEAGKSNQVKSQLASQLEFYANEKTSRLIDWNVDMLWQSLLRVNIRRKASGVSESRMMPQPIASDQHGKTVIDEVVEIIALPEFDSRTAKKEHDLQAEELDPSIKDELRDYVSAIASM
jgi:Adenylate and Guanylate cyclase catalytic domain